MGPVARIDLSDVPDALPEIMSAFHCGNPEVVLGFIISQREEVELWEMIEALYHFEDDKGTGIDACWLVEEIATSTAYDLVFGFAPAMARALCTLGPKEPFPLFPPVPLCAPA